MGQILIRRSNLSEYLDLLSSLYQFYGVQITK